MECNAFTSYSDTFAKIGQAICPIFIPIPVLKLLDYNKVHSAYLTVGAYLRAFNFVTKVVQA